MNRIIGWISLLLAVGLFCLQMGYMILKQSYQIEYIDYRLFYVINLVLIVLLLLAVLLLTTLRKWIGCSIAALLLTQGIMLFTSDVPVHPIISLSPNGQNLLLLKENSERGETIYYRTYFGILARPQQSVLSGTTGEFDVKWLANDVAAVTYQSADGSTQQFIGTYGDRGSGISYYNVSAEIYGKWQGGGIELARGSNGMTITENGETEHFAAEDIEQFGTLAIVLKQDGEAIWTVSLDESFQVDTDPFKLKEGTISIYKAAMEDHEPITLSHQDISD